jgi:hypothetical protein
VPAYVNDFKNLVNSSRPENVRAVSTLMDPRNQAAIEEMRRAGTWPRGLPADADAARVESFRRGTTDLAITDDHVAQVRNAIRPDIERFPENYGLPANPTPAQVDGILERIKPAGINSSDIERLVPTPGLTPLPTVPVVPQVPTTGFPLPQVIPVVPTFPTTIPVEPNP